MTAPIPASDSRRWLRRLGLEFWLPLPLLGVLFWFGGDWLTNQVLSRPYSTENQLQADTELEVNFSVTVSLVQATVNRSQGVTQVDVQTTDSELKTLTYEFQTADLNQVELHLAEKMGLSLDEVRGLVRYEIVE